MISNYSCLIIYYHYKLTKSRYFKFFSSLFFEWNFELYNYVILHIVHYHAWDTSMVNNFSSTATPVLGTLKDHKPLISYDCCIYISYIYLLYLCIFTHLFNPCASMRYVHQWGNEQINVYTGRWHKYHKIYDKSLAFISFLIATENY